MTVTIDEAKRCPRCSQAGQESGNHRGPKGSRVYTFVCMNEVCPWYETGWIVQVNSDGTIPEREAGPKEFEKLPNFDANKERVEEQIRREAEEQTRGR